MAKRTKKTTSRSSLKLEALEQRQLLAGGFTAAQGQQFADIVHPNGNVYDQVLLKSSSITVTNDPGQITRVSFLDLQGDIVQAEFSGSGSLTISLDADTFQSGVAPTNYNQSGVTYVQGLASFTIQGSDASTNFTVFSVGSATAQNQALFDTTHTGGNNYADVSRLTIVADPANPNGSIFGGIRAGNAIFSDDSGVVGIAAANVQVQDVVRIGDINATGTATPTLVFGQLSQFGSVDVQGGDMLSANGKAINNTGSYDFNLELVAGATSSGTSVAASNSYTQLQFTGQSAVEAHVPTAYELTTGVDAVVGGSANDTIVADNTVAPSQFTAADTINGGGGTDTLTIYGTNTTTVGAISGIENIVVDSMGAGATWNFTSVSGLQNLTNSRAVGASTVTVGNGVAITLANNAADTLQTANFGATDTSVSLTLNTIAAGTTGVTVGAAGASTLNVNTTGGASTVGTLTTPNGVKTLTINGDKDLTVTNALNTNVKTVNAGSLSGKLSIVTGNTADGDGNDIIVTGGSGNDTINITASDASDETSVAGGAGDDTVLVLATQISGDSGDTLGGGDGTDVLSVNFLDADTQLTTSLSGKITGIESITLTSDAVNVGGALAHDFDEGAAKTGVTSFTVNSPDALDSFNLTGLKADTAVKVSTSQAAVSVAIGTDTTADAVNLTLDGTTVGTLTATAYETVNITSTKDSGGATNVITTGALGAAKTVTLAGSGNLTGGTITASAGATFDASAYTGDLTATTFGATVKTYSGGSGKDEITLVAGDLKQGNAFAGGGGTDKLTVTATAGQDMGIVGLSGFETVALTLNGSNVMDLRNVTGLNTLSVAVTAGTDDITANRISGDTTLSFAATLDQVVTTVNTGESQKVAFSGNYTVTNLTLDSGTTSLTVTSDDGDNTANEAGGVFTDIDGTSLASITVAGKDQTNLGTLEATTTTVNASGATGGLTVIASGSATMITGSQAADTITGGAGADTIQGGKGNDTLNGGGASDKYVFEATGANNGVDTLTFSTGAGGDVLNFKNFLAGGSIDQNSAAGTGINEYTAANTNDVDISNKIVMYADATDTNIDTAAEIAALVQGAGDAFSISSGGKAIIITGDETAATANAVRVWYVDDSLDGVLGTIGAADVVQVATIAATEVDSIITSNITLV